MEHANDKPMSDELLAEIRTLIGHQRQYVAGIMRPPHEIDLLAGMEDLLAEVERQRGLLDALDRLTRLERVQRDRREAALLEIARAVATSNPYGSWLPPTNSPAGVVCRWCMERAYSPAQCQHDQECTWRQARALLASQAGGHADA